MVKLWLIEGELDNVEVIGWCKLRGCWKCRTSTAVASEGTQN